MQCDVQEIHDIDRRREVSGSGILGITGCLALVPFLHFVLPGAWVQCKRLFCSRRPVPSQEQSPDAVTTHDNDHTNKTSSENPVPRRNAVAEHCHMMSVTGITVERSNEIEQEPATPIHTDAVDELFLRESESCALVCGYAMNIQGVWVFTFAVVARGAWSFLCVYMLCMIFVSAPLLLLELALGQYTRRCSFDSAQVIHPIWRGLALCQLVVASSWCVKTLTSASVAAIYLWGCAEFPTPWATDSFSYLTKTVLNSYSGDLEGKGLGEIQVEIALTMGVVCFLAFLITARSMKFQATIARDLFVAVWILLLGLVFSCLQLSGWRVTLAAACGSALFSCVGGLLFFMLVGHYAVETGCSVADVIRDLSLTASEGNTMRSIFAVLPVAFFSIERGGNVVSVLFFFMLIATSLNTILLLWQHVLLCGYSFVHARSNVSKLAVSALVCVVFFSGGLPYCTRLGQHLVIITTENCSGLVCGLACGEAIMIAVSFKVKRMIISIRMATFGNPSTPNGRIIPFETTFLFIFHVVVPLVSFACFVYESWQSYSVERPSTGLEWYQKVTYLGMASSVFIGLWGSWRGRSGLPSLSDEEYLMRVALGEVSVRPVRPKVVFHVPNHRAHTWSGVDSKVSSVRSWVRGVSGRVVRSTVRMTVRGGAIEPSQNARESVVAESPDADREETTSTPSTQQSSVDVEILFGV